MGNSLMAALIKDGQGLAEWRKEGGHSLDLPQPLADFGLAGERILSQMPWEQKTLCRKLLKPSGLNLENLLWRTFLAPL